MERDYQKDLEVVENLFKEGAHAVNILYLVRDWLPWYINRCIGLENELQTANQALETLRKQLQQAGEREAAVKRAFEKWSNTASVGGEELDSLIHTIDALSSPSQPSRYREALAVVEAAREFMKCSSADMENICLCHCDKEPCPWNSLDINILVYDKAGEPQPIKEQCEDQRGDKCTVREAVCSVTGEDTCCLTCGKAKDCGESCVYVGQEPEND